MRLFIAWIAVFLCAAGCFGSAESDEAAAIRRTLHERASVLRPWPGAVKFRDAMKPDGSWADINYQDRRHGNWSAGGHLSRVECMARIWKGTPDPRYRDAVIRGLWFWAKNDPTSDNWWYQQIGTPLHIFSILLCLGDEVPPELLTALKPIIMRAQLDPKSTGQNMIWEATVMMYQGLFFNDMAKARAGRQIILDTMVRVKPGREGLQFDGAYLQHGMQLQFGNYGMSFLHDGLNMIQLYQGTAFAVPAEKLDLFTQYYLNGPRWMIWQGTLDLNASGRYVTQNSIKWHSGQFRKHVQTLAKLNPKAADWQAILDGDKNFCGMRYFPTAAMMVVRRPDYYISWRMCSKNVVGSETVCNENMQGRLLGNGTMQLLRDNSEYRDVTPLWDWKCLPGITAMQDLTIKDLQCPGCWKKEAYYNESNTVGGLTDGRTGSAMQELKHGKFRAKKSVFFFDRYFVAMGSGISAGAATTVNSCNLKGTPTVRKDGRRIASVTHDNVEYCFPAGTAAVLEAGLRTGRASDIISYEKKDLLKGKVFTLYIPHKLNHASYCYSVSPVANDGKAAAYKVLRTSSPDIHAVQDTASRTAMIHFFVPGSAEVPGIGHVASPEPLLLMISGKKLYYAGFMEKGKKVTITLGKKKLSLALPDYGVTGSGHDE